MKKSLLIAFMLVAFTSYAGEISGTNDNNSVEVGISLNNVKKGQRWFIKNASGKILHEETIKTNGSFQQKFDFTSLNNGYYTLEVNKDFQIQVTPFTIVSNEVVFHKKSEKTIFKPFVRNEDNKVFISKLNFETKALRVIIYYEDEIILKETVEGEEILKRVYALQKDKKGDYKVITKANDRTYINTFSL